MLRPKTPSRKFHRASKPAIFRALLLRSFRQLRRRRRRQQSNRHHKISSLLPHQLKLRRVVFSAAARHARGISAREIGNVWRKITRFQRDFSWRAAHVHGERAMVARRKWRRIGLKRKLNE